MSNPLTSPFTFIDLFCGIGGFHQALQRLGGECVFASDIDQKCRTVYADNYNMPVAGDITKIHVEDIPACNVVSAGFPCQPFSKSGFQLGFDDDRGNLFFNICKIVKHHMPEYLILENVRNLASHDNGNTWDVIRTHIDELGYHTYETPTILNVLHFNIPQNRERVVIMCKRKDLGPLQELPEIPKNPKTTLTRHIRDIIRPEDAVGNARYAITGKMKSVETVWDNFIQVVKSLGIGIPKFPIWTSWWDCELDVTDAHYVKYTSWINKNREFYETYEETLQPWLVESRQDPLWAGAVRKFEWQAGDLKEDDSMATVLWSARGSGIRVKRPDYVPTLVAMNMTPVYGPEHRKLTPRELLRLQSFPVSFRFVEKDIYKQVGNAVNVTMIERCASFLMFGSDLL